MGLRSTVSAILLLCAALSGQAKAQDAVVVFAAASLKGAMSDISALWVAQGHAPLRVSLGSSGTLARQIQQGAAAGLFISADEKWMDYLATAHMIIPQSRKDLLSNTLVLVGTPDGPGPVTIKPGASLDGVLGATGRLAVGDPASVPAGIYARQALTRLDMWNTLQNRLAPAADVKAALLLVERGEAPAGIVYGTDAKGDAKVRVLATFPSDSHDPISYPIALIAGTGDNVQARQVRAFLEGPQAASVFVRYGFGVR